MKQFALGAIALLAGSLVPGLAIANDEASVVRGGRLYDDWIREIKVHVPVGTHAALNAKNAAAAAAAADSLRCKECHGFDYKGSRGTVGIWARRGGDPAAIVAILRNATHGYDEVMQERDLRDLAAFVSRGQTDMEGVIEAARRAKVAPEVTAKYFGTICASCHGLEGERLRELLPLGDVARKKPGEVLHVILNGHPGGEMPALSALGADFGARMLLFLQTLRPLSLPVSIAHGGRLYDDWQAEEGARKQGLPHPAYPSTSYYANDASMTWRCKSCHGWDYQGNRGEYASGRNATGIKGIRGMAGAEPERIIAILRDGTHKFGAILKERDLLDLANFVSAGQIDMSTVIDRSSRRIRGDGARGGPYFRTLCVSCHGADGKRITVFLGRLVKANPYGSLHTVLNGHPDEKMPALRELDLQTVLDILAYVQGLQDTR
jgi:mono/diheme cytochrome c family protein